MLDGGHVHPYLGTIWVIVIYFFQRGWNHQLEWWLTSRGFVFSKQFDQSIDLAANTGARCWVPAKEKPATNWPHFMTCRPEEITKKQKRTSSVLAYIFEVSKVQKLQFLHVHKISLSQRIHGMGIFTYSHFPLFMWPFFTKKCRPLNSPVNRSRNRGNHEFAYMSRLWMGPTGWVFPQGFFLVL